MQIEHFALLALSDPVLYLHVINLPLPLRCPITRTLTRRMVGEEVEEASSQKSSTSMTSRP